MRLPFKVFSLLDFDKFIPKSSDSNNSELGYQKTNNNSNNKRESILSTEISDLVSGGLAGLKEKANPFRVEEKSQFEGLEYALQILEDMTSRLNTSLIFIKKLRFFSFKMWKTYFF